ncbi:MAG TPA: hypothetical protein VJU59_02250 [Paraburkholderia sp.]|uniref:hypothetical protein n=1 Tax=Paraburkholderia sp. TaxID=1926495 RepID=UPI002B4A3697|nr:hypothetical protein [Paraburkholderia sp.]HKR38493.1 hypothetical protein [Paraburkholderia sp.]
MEESSEPDVSSITVRSLYREESTGRYFRVVYTGMGQSQTYLVDIQGVRLKIREYSTHRFRALRSRDYQGEGKFTRLDPTEDPFDSSKQMRCETSAHKQKSKDNWRVIKGLVLSNARPPPILKLLQRRTRTAYLKDHAEKEGVPVSRLRVLLRRYFQRGMLPEAVASSYGNCGQPVTNALYDGSNDCTGTISNAPIEREYRSRPGAPPPELEYSHKLPGKLMRQLFWRYVDIYNTWVKGPWFLGADLPQLQILGRKILKGRSGDLAVLEPNLSPSKIATATISGNSVRGDRSRVSQRDIVDAINFELRNEEIRWSEQGHILKLKLRNDDVVTVRMFQHFLLGTRPSAHRRRRRHPEETVAIVRPEPGMAWQHAKGPGDIFLIDATVVDLYVVAANDRTVVVGRPTLYFIVDLWSTMIVGLHLTLDPPSRVGAAMALDNMLTPKPEFCARYGITIAERDWPCCYLPSSICSDRGPEYMSEAEWKKACDEMVVHICNPPPYRPTWRGIQERRFGIVPRQAQKHLSGVVERDFRQRGERYYPWDAKLTLAGLMQALLRAIDTYHTTPISGRQGVPQGMHEKGLANTPLNRWRWGIENFGCLREGDRNAVRNALWPTAKASVDGQGIHWRGIVYKSPNIDSEFLKAKVGGKKQPVEIRYNRSSLDSIYFVSYGFDEKCDLHPTLNEIDLHGVSLTEWVIYKKRRRAANVKALLDEQARRIQNAHNTRVDDAIAAHEQRKELKAKGMAHPDASDLKKARSKTRADLVRSSPDGLGTRRVEQDKKAEDVESAMKQRKEDINQETLTGADMEEGARELLV